MTPKVQETKQKIDFTKIEKFRASKNTVEKVKKTTQKIEKKFYKLYI